MPPTKPPPRRPRPLHLPPAPQPLPPATLRPPSRTRPPADRRRPPADRRRPPADRHPHRHPARLLRIRSPAAQRPPRSPPRAPHRRRLRRARRSNATAPHHRARRLPPRLAAAPRPPAAETPVTLPALDLALDLRVAIDRIHVCCGMLTARPAPPPLLTGRLASSASPPPGDHRIVIRALQIDVEADLDASAARRLGNDVARELASRLAALQDRRHPGASRA